MKNVFVRAVELSYFLTVLGAKVLKTDSAGGHLTLYLVVWVKYLSPFLKESFDISWYSI